MKRSFRFLLVLALGLSSVAFGADDELDLLLSQKRSPKKHEQTVSLEGIKDPFLKEFASDVLNRQRPSAAELSWIKSFISGNYNEALASYSKVNFQGPLKKSSDTALVYIFWKLNLAQSFINAWLEGYQRQGATESRLWVVLDQQIQPAFEAWLAKTPIILSESQKNMILSQKDEKSRIVLSLKAYANLKNPERSMAVLKALPADHPFKLPLAQSYAYGFVRRGDIKGAARAFREYVEPAVGALSDEPGQADKAAEYYLNVARLLYQGKQYDGSINYFDKVPKGSKQFLTAREEVIWPLLVKKDFNRLRGELETLSLPVYKSQYSPETYVVRALVNLQFCFFEQVERDIEDFMSINKDWAKRIDEALAQEIIPAPLEPDYYSAMSATTLASLKKEQESLKSVAAESGTPASGFWKEQLTRIEGAQKQAAAQRNQEFKRQWTNDKKVLAEAIRKMKFIRIEFLSETRLLQAKSQKWRENLLASRAMESRGSEVKSDAEQMVFKYDGTVWVDEMFNLRSTTPGRCHVWLRGNQK